MEFQQTMDKAADNQNLQFTAEIWTNDKNTPPSAKKDRVQIVTGNKFPFLDMKMSWSLEGYRQFGALRKKGQK